jgi:histidine ammonia-lyase
VATLAQSSAVPVAGCQVGHYDVHAQDQSGAIYPTANFEALPFTAPLEQILRGLESLSTAMANIVIRFEDPKFTHLPRYLAAPGNEGHAFGAIQKAVVALNNQVHMLTRPVAYNAIAVAGQIEDMGCNSELTAHNLGKVTEKLYAMASFQLLHATQAVDLRENFQLGEETKKLYEQYRKVVPYVSQNRIFTPDIAKGVAFLKALEV